jgi:hypothetical protein
MKMEIDFTFENPGEAEAFCETARTYPNVVAWQCEPDDERVLITVAGRDNIGKVLQDLAMCFRHGPAVGRYPYGK